MKILSSDQIREADVYTIANEPISSADLMERAATALFEALVSHLDPRKRTVIVCGTGNNGGDGLVIARLLNEHNYQVEAVVISLGDKSPDFNVNEERLSLSLEEAEPSTIEQADVLIDAIFGSGLNRPIEGQPAEIINAMNNSEALKIAIDIPSGLFADKNSAGVIFRADITYTFQQPKLAMMLPQNAPYVGEWKLIDIGLHQDFLNEAESPFQYTDLELASALIKGRSKFDHKGSFGKALLMAGSEGKMGAAVLAARACLRSGAGLLTVYVPRNGNGILQTSVPEAMTLSDSGDVLLTGIPELSPYSVVGIGPGIGTDLQTHYAVEEALRLSENPMVIDADAINIIAEKPHILDGVPENSILTPHPGEFKRLVGDWEDDFDRLNKQRSLATERSIIVVLKGAHTSIALPDGTVFFNETGNPGMATAGSGDVLTGIITGLLAQGYKPEEAAITGVYLHGLSGDIASNKKTQPAMIAGDIISCIPEAYHLLF